MTKFLIVIITTFHQYYLHRISCCHKHSFWRPEIWYNVKPVVFNCNSKSTFCPVSRAIYTETFVEEILGTRKCTTVKPPIPPLLALGKIGKVLKYHSNNDTIIIISRNWSSQLAIVNILCWGWKCHTNHTVRVFYIIYWQLVLSVPGLLGHLKHPTFGRSLTT